MTELDHTHVLILAAAAAPVVYAAYCDLRRFRIPNECSLALLALYPLYAIAAPAGVDVTGAVIAAAGIFAVTFGLYMWDKLGGGDVKLLSVLALWAGPAMLADLIVITTVTGAGLALVFVSRLGLALAMGADALGQAEARDNILAERMPYGVAIAAGGLAVFAGLAG